jgi:hypothetical protein
MQLVSSRAVSLLKLRAVTTDGGCSCSSWVCRCKMRCVAGEGVGLSRGEKTTAVALPCNVRQSTLTAADRLPALLTHTRDRTRVKNVFPLLPLLKPGLFLTIVLFKTTLRQAGDSRQTDTQKENHKNKVSQSKLSRTYLEKASQHDKATDHVVWISERQELGGFPYELITH